MTAKPINQLSGMPQIVSAFNGWTKPISLTARTQTIVNGLVDYIDKTLVFRGTIQPLSPEEVALKPEGQRSWKWLQIHVTNGALNLTTDDQIVYNGLIYKVKMFLDYSLNGYSEYHVVYEYQP